MNKMSPVYNIAAAVQQDKHNRERLEAWRFRYYHRLGWYPRGDILRHRRLCIIDDHQRLRAQTP